MRDSMVFYRSFYEAIKELPLDVQAKVYSAIFEYSLNFNEVVLEGLPKTIFTLIKPQLDANNKRFENGKKGGRKKVDNNQTETKTEPNNNVNDNDNVNDNVIVTLKENKVFNFEFVEEYLQIPFHTWLQYKSEIGQPYNSQIALEKCYSELENLSGKNSKTAYEIVDGCISANSRSLYKKKDFSSPKTEVKPHKFNFKDADR